MWLICSDEIRLVEDHYRTLTRCVGESKFLRSRPWIEFRQRMIRYLDLGDHDAIQSKETLAMPPGLRLVVLESYPNYGGVLDVVIVPDDSALEFYPTTTTTSRSASPPDRGEEREDEDDREEEEEEE